MSRTPGDVGPPLACSPEIFAELQAHSSPRVVVATEWRWMEAYGQLDEAELQFRRRPAEEHPDALAAWLRQIALFRLAFTNRTYDWRQETDRERAQAVHLRLDLLGLAATNSKLALDALLGGYYSGCMAIERHMLESWRRAAYARVHPEDIWRWYPKETWPDDVLLGPKILPAKVPSAVDIATAIQERGNDLDKMFLPNVGRGIKALNAHSHPTIEGASHLWDVQDPDRRYFGPLYGDSHCRRCLKWGLFAGTILLAEIREMAHLGDTWNTEFQELMTAAGELIFRENSGSTGGGSGDV